MKALVLVAVKWAREALIEWLEGPEGRLVVVKVLRDLAAKTETKLDDKAVELVIKGLENV